MSTMLVKVRDADTGEPLQFHVEWDQFTDMDEARARKKLEKLGCNAFRLSHDYVIYLDSHVTRLDGWITDPVAFNRI